MKEHIHIFLKYLRNLQSILVKIEKHFEGNDDSLKLRLTDDMLPLASQIEITVNFALRTCCPIAGKKVVSFEQEEKSFSNLKSQINKAIDYLNELQQEESDFNRVIKDKAGPAAVSLPAKDFILQFAYPNFFFHLSMVYAIARANGVYVSKGDYDGFHTYPVGFSFE